MSWSLIFQALGSLRYWLSPPKATHLQRLHRASAFCSLHEALSGQEGLGGWLKKHQWLCQHAWPCLPVLLTQSSTATVVLFVLEIVEELDWRTSLPRGHLLSLQNCLYLSQFHHSILNNGFLLSDRAWEETQYYCSDIAEKPAPGTVNLLCPTLCTHAPCAKNLIYRVFLKEKNQVWRKPWRRWGY